MSNNKSSGVTLYNFLAIVGFVLFGVFTYFGQMFLTGGEVASSILWTLGFIALLVTLYVLAVLAKAKEEYPKAWRAVEWTAVGFYVVYAAFTCGGVVHFFSVMGNKEELTKAGQADVQAMREMFLTYEDFEETAITNSEISMRSLIGRREIDGELQKILQDNNIELDERSISAFFRKQREVLLTGKAYTETKQNYEARLKAFESDLKGWKVFSLPQLTGEMERVAEDMAEWLTKKSEKDSHLPVVYVSHTLNQTYVKESNQSTQISVPKFKFGKETGDFLGNSILAWVGLIVIHLLIIVSYLLAPRSLIIMPAAKVEGGIVLGGQVL